MGKQRRLVCSLTAAACNSERATSYALFSIRWQYSCLVAWFFVTKKNYQRERVRCHIKQRSQLRGKWIFFCLPGHKPVPGNHHKANTPHQNRTRSPQHGPRLSNRELRIRSRKIFQHQYQANGSKNSSQCFHCGNESQPNIRSLW